MVGARPSKSPHDDVADTSALRTLFIRWNFEIWLGGRPISHGANDGTVSKLGTPEKLNYRKSRKGEPYGNRCMALSFTREGRLSTISTFRQGGFLRFTPDVTAFAAPPPDHFRFHNHRFKVLFAAACT